MKKKILIRTFRLIKYPLCWKMLELLQKEEFINFWKENRYNFTGFYIDQIFYHYTNLSSF